MSTPLDHPLRQTIAAMARTRDALVELARRIDEAGLGPAHEGQEIASMANSEQREPRAVTDNTASPASPAPSSQPTPSNSQTGSSSPRRWWLVVEPRGKTFAKRSQEGAAELAEASDEIIPVVEASAYDAAVRERDHWKADSLRNEERTTDARRALDAARAELAGARRLTPALVERVAKAVFDADEWRSWNDAPFRAKETYRARARAALLAAGFQEDEA